MKVHWTIQPSYETMQRLWREYPEADPIDFTENNQGEVKQVFDETIIVTDPENWWVEHEVSINQIHIV